MNAQMFKKILKEEVALALTEASITKRFQKAVEALQTIQLKQQELRKKFVSEKDPKKKEKLKQSLISLHKKVEQAEKDFNKAVTSEPIDDDVYEGTEELVEKSKGLWANIHAKRKRGEKPAHKNSKAHKDAVKAAKSINKEGKVNEALARGLKPLLTIGTKITKKVGEEALLKLSDKFDRIDDEYAGDIASHLDMAIELMQDGYPGDATKMLKQFNKKCKDVLKGKTVKSVFAEGKLNEDVWKSFLGDDSAFKLHMATNTEKRKSVKARKTDKTWDDGVPVLKYIARASKKDSPLPKGKFKIIEDNKHGWWYYQVGNIWYGISQKDYGTPPFEY